MIDLELLIKNGVHFGHQTDRWSPKMEPYIWGFKNGIHLIDVMKTAHHLERAAKFLEQVASEGKTILLVGTKKAAQDAVKEAADTLSLPYVVHRWVGGTFTNHRQVRKAIANLVSFEEVLKKSDESHHTKKELNLLKKRAGRLENIVGGIRNLRWPVGAVVVVDVRKENVVVKEAMASGIPVVGLVDTNSDPTDIDYVIPGNDDSPRSIRLLVDYLGQAITRGQKVAAEKPQKVAAVEEVVLETLYDEEPEVPTAKKPAKKAAPKKAAPKKTEAAAATKDEPSNDEPSGSETKGTNAKKSAPVKAAPKKAAPKKPAAKPAEKKADDTAKKAAKPAATKSKVTRKSTTAQDATDDKVKPAKAKAAPKRATAKTKEKTAE